MPPGRPSITSSISAFWHALGCWAKLWANRKSLRDDTRYRVDVTIDGSVSGYPVHEELHASLAVGSPSQQASSHSIPTAELVAWLWDQVPATRRLELQDLLAAYWAEHQEVPAIDEARVKAAKLWLQRLRATVQKEREGPVSLDCDGDAETAAAAEERFAA
jgi:hypothetical protein